MKSLQLGINLLVGAGIGVAIVVACGDSTGSPIDAATADAHCSCPEAEPPLAGRIISVEDIRPASDIAVAKCPVGSTLLGGGCDIRADTGSEKLRMDRVGARTTDDTKDRTYICSWDNPDAVTITEATAWAKCLVPPQ